MKAAIYEKARENRVLALRTVAARNAEPRQLFPSLPVGANSRRGPKLELVTPEGYGQDLGERIVA